MNGQRFIVCETERSFSEALKCHEKIGPAILLLYPPPSLKVKTPPDYSFKGGGDRTT